MEATLFLRNKLRRHIMWNGQPLTFKRYEKNEYLELQYDKVIKTINLKGLFHDGGGYGGMLNIEIYERDGGRTFTKFKPMVLCLYEDGKDITTDDVVKIFENTYRVVEKSDVKNLGIVYEISLELDNGKE